MIRPARHRLLPILCLGAAALGCSLSHRDRAPYFAPPEAENQDRETMGSLGLSLLLPTGTRLEAISAELTSPVLAAPVVRTVLVASDVATGEAKFGGLPPGDYAVTLSAQSADGTSCSGAATFAIQTGQAAGVVVPLHCQGDGSTGEVVVSVGLDFCPRLEFLFVAPVKTSVGSPITVEASVSDPDGDPVTYSWSATAGSFEDALLASTSYLCSVPGVQTIALITNEGGDCEQRTQFAVACVLTEFTDCAPGEVETQAPSEFSDRQCSPCPPDSFNPVENGATCLPLTTCAAGQFVSVPATGAQDQSCAPCPAGTFAAEENAPSCLPFSECAWAQLEVGGGSSTSDTECSSGGEPFRQFGTSAADGVNAVALDTAGNVFVAGVTQGALAGPSAGGYDAFLRRYDRTGVEVWTVQLGTSSQDYANAVAVGPSGNVYLAGNTVGTLEQANTGLSDAIVRKYDVAGNLLWAQQFGTAANDYIYGVAIDGAENVYLSGATQGGLDGANLGGPDGFLRKLSADGTVLWTRQYGTASFEYPAGVAVDTSGNVYVAGGTSGSLGGPSAGSQDGYLQKYSADGDVLFTNQFGTSGMDTVHGPAVDGAGLVYVVGGTSGVLSGTGAGSQDAFVVAFEAGGAVVFTQQFGTSGVDVANGVAAVATGGVFVAGITTGSLDGPSSGSTDAFVRFYSQVGELGWSTQYGSSSSDTAIATAADGSPAAFAAGSTGGALVGVSAGGTDGYVAKFLIP